MGYDFNFHPPKSLSVLYSLTKDERILDAFRESVNETMLLDMEPEMQTRVRKEARTASGQRGTFCTVSTCILPPGRNPAFPIRICTPLLCIQHDFDEEEAAWKAGQFGDLKRDAPYFEAKFHSRLGRKLAGLGLGVERTRTGWEIEGIGKSVTDKFSRRTQEIEEVTQSWGSPIPWPRPNSGPRRGKARRKTCRCTSFAGNGCLA